MAGDEQPTGGDLRTPPGFKVDLGLLREFERGLNPRRPETSAIPARVLGYGEISTVFSIHRDELKDLALKRLPIFETPAEMAAYRGIYEEYNRVLEEEVGIQVAPNGYASFVTDTGRPVFYIIQKEESADSICHRAMQKLSHADVPRLFEGIVRELRKVWDFNARQDRLRVAIDGQISNWAIVGFEPDQAALPKKLSFRYLDTSTPLFQVGGQEQLDPELFLRSAPSFLRWLLRLLFLDDVMNRYYDFHKVVVDIIANFYKEQRAEYVPDLVRAANAYFSGEGASLGVAPFTEKEVEDYYKEDRLIWSVYLSMRRLDRFLHTQVLRREYPYILPGPIQR